MQRFRREIKERSSEDKGAVTWQEGNKVKRKN